MTPVCAARVFGMTRLTGREPTAALILRLYYRWEVTRPAASRCVVLAVWEWEGDR